MGREDWANGCVGCIDYGINNRSCDYLLNNGHCRPCKADASGCECYSVGERMPGKTEEECRTWDTEEARRLLMNGMAVEEVAKELGASVNSLQAWIVQGMPAGVSVAYDTEVRNQTPKGVWNEEVYRELYKQGLTDPEAAERMGLNYQTVWKHRKRLGLPANGKKKKGCSVFL